MRRLFLASLLLVLLPLLAFSTRWFLSDLYYRSAIQSDTTAEFALAAAQAAASLAPWKIEPRQALARSLATADRSSSEVDSVYWSALEWSPANAYLWQDFAQLLAYQNRFGAEFEFSLKRASTLAPTSSTLQINNAMLGLRYWLHGSESLQRLWLRSMLHGLQKRPKKFLSTIYSSGQMYWFCASPALELPVAHWCKRLWSLDDPQLILDGGIQR